MKLKRFSTIVEKIAKRHRKYFRCRFRAVCGISARPLKNRIYKINSLRRSRLGAERKRKMSAYGYERVSSLDQNESRQLIEIKKPGIPESQIYVDKQSGKNFDRPGYRKMLKRLRKGDVIFVLSIDRLGRKYEKFWNNGDI